MRECRECRVRTDCQGPYCPVCGHSEARSYILQDPRLWWLGMPLLLPLRLVALLFA